jgi:hypothetical protein
MRNRLTLHCLNTSKIADIKAKVEGAHGRVSARGREPQRGHKLAEEIVQ